jgi:hypothetical protein
MSVDENCPLSWHAALAVTGCVTFTEIVSVSPPPPLLLLPCRRKSDEVLPRNLLDFRVKRHISSLLPPPDSTTTLCLTSLTRLYHHTMTSPSLTRLYHHTKTSRTRLSRPASVDLGTGRVSSVCGGCVSSVTVVVNCARRLQCKIFLLSLSLNLELVM